MSRSLAKPRAPSALLEMRSWALRDFVAITGVGVAMDMDKEAKAFAVRLFRVAWRCSG